MKSEKRTTPKDGRHENGAKAPTHRTVSDWKSSYHMGTSSYGLIPAEFDDMAGTLAYCRQQILGRGVI